MSNERIGPTPVTALDLARLLCGMKARLQDDGKGPWRITRNDGGCGILGPGCPWCEEAEKHIRALVFSGEK